MRSAAVPLHSSRARAPHWSLQRIDAAEQVRDAAARVMLLDVTPKRMVCEQWFVDSVASISTIQACSRALEVRAGTDHLLPSKQTQPRAAAPPLAT